MNPVTGRIIIRALLLVFAAFVIWTLVSSYRSIRSERVNTRLSIGLADGEHDLIMSIPSGSYQVQFAPEANVSPVMSVSPQPVLPAHITTKIVRGSGGDFIVPPVTKEYFTFRILPADAFQPNHLHVTVSRDKPCNIYMNLSLGF
jgi:hypothetical protein